MTESEAIQIANDAADKIGYPWNAASVVAKRQQTLLIFPVWRVTSDLPEENYVVRATIPNGATHATRIEMISTQRLSARAIRLRIYRPSLEALLLGTIALAAIRQWIPSTVPRDTVIAAVFAILCTFVIETTLAQRTMRRELHNHRPT